MTHIKFGWRVPTFPVDGSQGSTFTNQITHTLEQIQDSFDSAWVADHLVPWADWEEDTTDLLECMATICYLAAAFPTLQFGNIVLCQSYRNPALLAKMASTLQTLSGGRFILGIGAGWKEDEYRAYDYEFPKASVRIAQLDEAVQIIRALWIDAPATFQGKYYSVRDAYCEPKPEPHPPILIGGGGEKLTLRVVAKYADWWNMPGTPPDVYAHKLTVLQGHCQAVGRNFDDIVKTWDGGIAIAETEEDARQLADASPFGIPIVGTPDTVADALRVYTDMNVEHFMLRFADFPNTAGIELFAREVIPQFQT